MHILISVPILLIGSLLSPFFLLQIAILWIAYLLISRFVGKERARISVWLGAVLMWSTIFITHSLSRTNEPQTPDSIVAVSGFPVPALYYPAPPMGADFPPLRMWPAFFLDYAFWIAIAFFASKPIAALAFWKTKFGRRLAYAFALSAFGLMAAGFVHVLIAFD